MIRKGVFLFLFVGAILTFASCTSGLSFILPSTQPASYSEMPYRGLIIGSYWQEWPYYHLREFVEPNVLFIGIVQYDGPMMTHYYRFEIHIFHTRASSLIVESFKGIQQSHFLCGFSRFYTTNSHTTLRQFRGEFQGVVVQQLGAKNIYYIISLKVNGTGLYYTQTGFEHRVISEVLHHRHYIELREFNGTRTPFYLAGTGLFYYYYLVPYGPHPFQV